MRPVCTAVAMIQVVEAPFTNPCDVILATDELDAILTVLRAICGDRRIEISSDRGNDIALKILRLYQGGIRDEEVLNTALDLFP
jgi:hypothetical protein